MRIFFRRRRIVRRARHDIGDLFELRLQTPRQDKQSHRLDEPDALAFNIVIARVHVENAVGELFVRTVVAENERNYVLTSDFARDGRAGIVRRIAAVRKYVAGRAVEFFHAAISRFASAATDARFSLSN